jgi:hypothetical protein
VPAVAQVEVRVRTLSHKSLSDTPIDAPMGFLDLAVDHPQCRILSGKKIPIDTTRNYLVTRVATAISLRPAHGTLVMTASRAKTDQSQRAAAEEEREPSPHDAANAEGGLLASNGKVQKVVVELPIAVGRATTRVLAVGLIAVAIGAHALDLDAIGTDRSWAFAKAGIVLLAAFVALWLGLKPDAGE